MSQRYYASKDYALPADNVEATRLNLQHFVLTNAFDNRLSLAPQNLRSGDRILETATGTGVWAFEFHKEKNRENSIVLDIQCCDISDRLFPRKHPPNIHFTIHSVTDLPVDWKETFVYTHQRLVHIALNDSRWRKAISEIFRVLRPDGWVELVEFEAKDLQFGIGPHSKRLASLVYTLYAENGIIQNLAEYLPLLLKSTGFIDISCVSREVPIGRSDSGYLGSQWGTLWAGTKEPVLRAGGYNIVKTEKEFDALIQESVMEWDRSDQVASATFYTFLARKPSFLEQ